ncbi:hypothetical protein PT974_00325 [Cladobotryum mycophilum]|uniref:Azaphilone pigments biosynthesis cluster protein L N-terminal domain-containing protein n=1 Tax=Cladobotryum mycophilum TaxID=491253 RepID=A0ABR0T0T1_9HYPO
MSYPDNPRHDIIGLLHASLHGSNCIIECIASLRRVPRDIAAAAKDLGAFSIVLEALLGAEETLSSHADLYDSLRMPLTNWLDILSEFMAKLDTYTETTEDGSNMLNKTAWPLKNNDVQQFRQTIVAYKASLTLAVAAAILPTPGSLNERTKGREQGFNTDSGHIQAKIEALDTNRIEWTPERDDTDTRFTLNRFLDYSGSTCDSPPPSFPGSPGLSPSGSDVILDYDIAWTLTPTKNGTQDRASTSNDHQVSF